MAEPQNDGGPAFPQSLAGDGTGRIFASGEHGPYSGGMTLRDWFAGQALVGLMNGLPFGHPILFDQTASHAYAQADAMLAAREAARG